MLLLTGATGVVGRALLERLVSAGTPVRCLVRDPRRLGPDRVRVQLALGDLADPPSFRNALRGVSVVVHLAQTLRDQPGASIEELDGIATWRLVEAASRAGVERFVFLSSVAATGHSRARFLRAKAVAERAVREAPVPSTVVAPSLVVDRSDRFSALVRRLALLPAVPLSGAGRAEFQPIWAGDVAAALAAVLERGHDAPARVELCGPQVLTRDDVVRAALAGAGRERPLVHVPPQVARAALRAGEVLLPGRAPLTWDEAELFEVSATSPRGTDDARALGVSPRAVGDVFAVG
jgi:NADH dehydrogenase